MPLSLVGRDPEIAFYAAQVTRHGAPVLLLGSGDGELAFAIAARGHRVVGVEPSDFLIAEAETRRAAAPQAQVKLVRGDLRTVRFDEKFSTVLAPRNALSLLPGL